MSRKDIARGVYDILRQYCAPIHYRSEIFNDLVSGIVTGKRAGPREAFRQALGNESKYQTFVENGYIGLSEWRRMTQKLIPDWPYEYMPVSYSKSSVRKAFVEFGNRKPFMLDKGLPVDIRINGLVAEEAVKEWLTGRYGEMVKDKEVTDYQLHCDHDFVLEYQTDSGIVRKKVDVKSCQSKSGTWSIGKNVSAKDDFYYIFTTGANKHNRTLKMVGWQEGWRLKDIEGRIRRRHILDIRLLIGYLSYHNKKTWIK